MRLTRHATVLVVGVGVLMAPVAGPLRAQTTATRPAFEVASVKPSPPGSSMSIGPAPGRLVATGITLKSLVQFAYRRQSGRTFFDHEILGGPSWIESDRFDLQAKIATPNVPFDQVLVMLQGLLEDRFHLKVHREKHDGAIYALVRVRPRPGLKPSDDQTPVSENGPRRFDPAGPQPRGTILPSRSNDGAFVLTGVAVPIASVVNTLERYVNRPVIDATALDGLFDLRLTFGPPASAADPSAAGRAPDGPLSADLSAPPLMTALEEQLGLKLESRRAPVEVVVIDQAERPTPD